LKITHITGYSTTCQLVENNKPETILYNVMPDTGHYSKVVLSYKTSLWNEFFNTGKTIQNAIKGLNDLKDHLGDTKRMYGYEVEMINVTDTAFLFSSEIVPALNKKAAFKNLYESLIQFAKEKDLGYNGTRIFYILPFGKDSLHLFTSIGITNTGNAPLSGSFILKRMPYMGRLLMCYYQGSFGNVDAALNALELFKSDNGMNSMAIPFIKLITEGIEFGDSQIIQARALYPVY
jgi:effector-binding domain-containing protein